MLLKFVPVSWYDGSANLMASFNVQHSPTRPEIDSVEKNRVRNGQTLIPNELIIIIIIIIFFINKLTNATMCTITEIHRITDAILVIRSTCSMSKHGGGNWMIFRRAL